MSDPQFQPPQVFVEGTWLYGAIVTSIFYGIVLVLYLMCAHSLWYRISSRGGAAKKHWFFFTYVTIVFALSTLYQISNARITQLGFINHRDYPGGPSAYEINTASAPLNVAFVVSNWFADALMIWRCVVVYRDSKFHHVVTVFGCLMLLGSVVTGALWVIIVSQPAQSATGWMSFTFLFPYISVSLATNVLVCILTVLRLLYHRACISKALGPAYGMLYASFAAMVVESASVYAVCSLLYLVTYAASSSLANAFLQILGEAQVVAPLLIIYRVSEGKAWTKDIATRRTPSVPRQQSRRSPANARPSHIHLTFKDAQHGDLEVSVRSDENKDLAV